MSRTGVDLEIVYVTRTLAAYRHSVLDALEARGARVTVIVAGRPDDEVPFANVPDSATWEVALPVRRRIGWRTEILTLLRALEPDVVLLEHGARLGFTWTVLLDRGIRAPKILWTHGLERKERFTGRWSLGSEARRIQLRLADGILCYDEATAALLQPRYPDKVVGFATNTIDRSAFRDVRARLQAGGRTALRESLGLPDRLYLVGLGRLISEKGFLRLPRLVRALRAKGIDVGAIFIGDGPQREWIVERSVALGLREGEDVFLPGEETDPERLMTWLYAGDVCVNPGCLGLSVVDCASAGIPVISCLPGPRGPYHGPEWRYIVDGVTGWLAAEDSDDAFTALALDYLRRPAEERAAVERACMTHAEANLGIETMINGMLRTCEAVLADRRRTD